MSQEVLRESSQGREDFPGEVITFGLRLSALEFLQEDSAGENGGQFQVCDSVEHSHIRVVTVTEPITVITVTLPVASLIYLYGYGLYTPKVLDSTLLRIWVSIYINF